MVCYNNICFYHEVITKVLFQCFECYFGLTEIRDLYSQKINRKSWVSQSSLTLFVWRKIQHDRCKFEAHLEAFGEACLADIYFI